MQESMRSVRAVGRALDLLDIFMERAGALGVGEIARLSSMPKSTAYRLLLTMETRGYVERAENDKFQLGNRLRGTVRAHPALELKILAQPVLEGLRDTCGETVGLHVLDGDARICIAAAEGVRSLRTSGRVGSKAPLYSGASSKSIMAFLPESRWDEVIARTGLKPLTANTITDPERLRAELLSVRAAGFAVSTGEWGEGITSVAVPIFDAFGAVIASVNISGPSFRFGDQKIQLMAGALKAAADAISSRLRAAVSASDANV